MQWEGEGANDTFVVLEACGLVPDSVAALAAEPADVGPWRKPWWGLLRSYLLADLLIIAGTFLSL